MAELIKGEQAVLYYGKELYGDSFNLDDPLRKKMYYNLYLYFTGKEEGPWDPKKSILLTGSLGVGKSAAFKVYQQIFHRYKIVAAETIELDLKKNGEVETLEKYGYEYRNDLVIDDIGSESREVHVYKNAVSIIGLILKQRYRLFIDHGFKTHATSNFTSQELKIFYNDQNYDRLTESSKLIAWTGKSLRGK